MSGENLQKKKTHPSTSNVPFSTCGTAPKIRTLVAKYTSQKQKKNIPGRSSGRVFFVFLLKVGRGWSFFPKQIWKRLGYFLVFFLFWRLFEVGFWRHQQLISRMDEEDLKSNMSTTNQQKDLWPFRKWSTKFAKFLWLCQNLDKQNLCFFTILFKLRSVFKTENLSFRWITFFKQVENPWRQGARPSSCLTRSVMSAFTKVTMKKFH